MPHHLGTGATTLAEGYRLCQHMVVWQPYTLRQYRYPLDALQLLQRAAALCRVKLTGSAVATVNCRRMLY